MSLTPGARLGAYEVVTLLGAGGMGEVYRARDTRLDRTVAVKVLPSAFAAEPDLRERFDREAKAIAALNHPHICVLHDVGRHDGTDFLVMEYLEGETLATRLEKGALPVDQALLYATQMADALDMAHRRGIVHRDLKPGNVMLTKAGAKLLDFGLAKSMTPAAASGLSALATTPHSLTAQGTFLGTLQYMAPEQLEGGVGSERSDIFALGIMLFEMITGRRAFEGKSQASIIGAILRDELPPVSRTQPLASPLVDHLVVRCVEKNPEERWQTAGDVLRELRWISGNPQLAPKTAERAPASRWTLYTAAGVIALVIAPLLLWNLFTREPVASTVRLPVMFSVNPPDDAMLSTAPLAPFPSLSPDGRLLGTIWVMGGSNVLWLRAVDSLEWRRVQGSDGIIGGNYFWSPDSRSIGFVTEGKLKVIDVDGGQARIVCDAPGSEGGAWNEHGIILFSREDGSGLFQVSAEGGAATPVTTVDRSKGETSHRQPHFLPDGRRFLYFVAGTQAIKLGSLDGSISRELFKAESKAFYSDPGYVLYASDGNLRARTFDAVTGEVGNDVFTLARNIRRASNGRPGFGVSLNGILAYRLTNPPSERRVVVVDRTSGAKDVLVARSQYVSVELSPDEQRLALSGDGDIWVLDIADRRTARVTSTSEIEWAPIWSVDGTRLSFRTGSKGPTFSIVEKNANGQGAESRLVQGEQLMPLQWSPDGQQLLYTTGAGGTVPGRDLWTLPRHGHQKPVPIIVGNFDAGASAHFSPDGRLLAYTSRESGGYDVYVQPFPADGSNWRISPNAGSNPRWRGDGRELFYVAGDGQIMAVAVSTTPHFNVLGEQRVFQSGLSLAGNHPHQYAVSKDGKRFFLTEALEDNPAPLTVVVNWPVLLSK